MASSDGETTRNPGGGDLVAKLARSVISTLSENSQRHHTRRIDVGTNILTSAILADTTFDPDQMKLDLQAFRLSAHDVIDHCIPKAAEHIGQGWVDDTLGFARVSIASARLYSLCKTVGQEWDGLRPPLNTKSILLATVEREDHIIGTAVLAEQLRRRGHSVKVLQNSTGPEIATLLRNGQYDGVFISSSSLTTLDYAKKAIINLKKQKIGIPIVLGGACLGAVDIDPSVTGADLVTNNIDMALDALTLSDAALRVAE